MRITRVDFGSLFTYTPRGIKTVHRESRNVMVNLKNDIMLGSGRPISEQIARTIKKDLLRYPFSSYFSDSTILIPIPSGPPTIMVLK